MATLGATNALVVTRFDRRWQGVLPGAEQKARFKPPADAWIARLPQEDFCQALGVAPDHKYESDGGPSTSDGLAVLVNSQHADANRATLALAQLAFWLMAATDGHAKNSSIQHQRGGHFNLAPLYDVLSAWPIIGRGARQVPYQRAKLAMAVRGKQPHYRLQEITPRHWRRLADASGPGVRERMVAAAEGVDAALLAVEDLLPPEFPAEVWTPIADGMRRHAQKFLKAAA